MTQISASRADSHVPMPPTVLLLGLGTFLLATSEFLVVGLLPEVATQLGIDVGRASLLVSVFAFGMVLGAPVMTLLTLRLDQRRTLLIACLTFAVAHVLVGVTENFAVLVALRGVGALACATYWSLGAVIAVQQAPRGRTAEALAMMIGGVTLAAVLGVPIGTWAGQLVGWRASFVLLGLLALVATALFWLVLPSSEKRTDVDLTGLASRELRSFRRPALLFALATTALSQTGIFAAFTYLIPLLTSVGAITSSQAPTVLFVYGAGALIGTYTGGGLARYSPSAVLLGGLALLCLTIVTTPAIASVGGAAMPSAFSFGLFAFSLGGVLNARVFQMADAAPTLAAAVNVSAFNVGNMLGPWLGGCFLASGAGLTSAWHVAALTVGLAAATAIASMRLHRRNVIVSHRKTA